MSARPLAPANLTELRLNRGLSQVAAAEEAGVTKSVWNRAENGDAIAPANARLIASFFGLKVTDIWPIEPESTEVAAA